jgi:Uma2 family endonuclease
MWFWCALCPIPSEHSNPGEILLVVEISETSIARDTGPKRLAYAVAGIPYYWVIDGERSVIHVYREPVAGDYADVSTVRFGAPLAVPETSETIIVG